MANTALMKRNFCTFVHNAEACEVVVLDLETTIVDGSPRATDGAEIVMGGILCAENTAATGDVHILGGADGIDAIVAPYDFPAARVLVGHNIKFDLGHLFARYGVVPVMKWLEQFVAVIDTGINEYLISGQTNKMPSLGDTCAKRGVPHPTKDHIADTYFSKGIGADLVPPAELAEYLGHDLRATFRLYCHQMENTGNYPLFRHFWVQGWATVVYAMMEHNGLRFDTTRTDAMHRVVTDNIQRQEELVRRWVTGRIPELRTAPEEFKLSPRTLSTAFFGYPGIPVYHNKVVGKYKNGKPKTKKTKTMAKPLMHLKPKAYFPASLELNETLGYPMDDSTLKAIENKAPSEEAKVAAIIRQWRAGAKILGTYLEPIRLGKTLTGDMGKEYRVLHPNFNQTVTATGRTSSSKPNGQNMTEDVKALVRWERVLNFDFSQLEVWGAATLSRDLRMLKDVRDSDIHFETGKETLGWSDPEKITKQERRGIKGVNFGIIYGGGKKTISEQTGMDEDLVAKHIRVFKGRYVIFSNWQDALVDTVNRLPAHSPVPDADGRMTYATTYVSSTGRRYTFRQKWVEWKGDYSFSPPEIKNYPVQGFATADVVPLFLVTTFVFLKAYEYMQPFAAVHDSVSAYSTWETCPLAEGRLKEGVRSMSDLIHVVYDLPTTVALDGEIETTDHWA
jgi:DNA polymerase I-like protein with 3'-5' exonuclease and polymerase domains